MAARAAEQIERDWSTEGALLGVARGPRTGTHAQAARANQNAGAAANSVARNGPGRDECGLRGGRARIADGGVRTLARDRVWRSRSEEGPREGFDISTHCQGSDQLPAALPRTAAHGRAQRKNR